MRTLSTLLLATTAGLGLSAALPASGWAAGDDGMIQRLCLAGFNAAMSHAGKTPPAGMGASIQSAQDSCKQKAAARYKV
jgi:hypothetical protein